MAKHLTTNSLIESIKTRAMIPETQNTFTEARFLSFANEEMDLAVVPLMLGFHEDYFLDFVDIPLERDTSRYQIPDRAIGNKLRDVAFVDRSGSVYEMTRITVEDIPYFQFGQVSSNTSLNTFYIENDEVVLVPQTAKDTGFVRMYYYIRPSQIVSENRVAIINSAPNFNTGVVSVSSIPSNITASNLIDINKFKSPHITYNMSLSIASLNTSTNELKFGTANIQNLIFPEASTILGSTYFTHSDSFSGVKTLFWFQTTGTDTQPNVTGIDTFVEVDIQASITGTDVASAVLAVTNLSDIIVTQTTDTLSYTNGDLVGDQFSLSRSGNTLIGFTDVQQGQKVLNEKIVTGDYISIEEEAIIPQIPTEAHSLLSQRVAARCLEAMGDAEGLQIANAKIAEMEQKMGALVDTRVDGAPQKVYSRHGFVRNSRKYYRR